MSKHYTQDLETIALKDTLNEEENDRFQAFLVASDQALVDQQVHRLNIEVSNAIDCTRCGNCCRSLMINISPGEPERIAPAIGLTTEAFKAQYVEESQQGQMIVNTIPCHFLTDNKCTIYPDRFAECREFPHLHKPGFTTNRFIFFMHYHRCPIIYNVIEQLKETLSFK